MEWERAKTYVLIAFVILNLALAGLLFYEDTRYTLSSDRISNIHTVLSNNNINLYAHLARRFAPMRHLEISGYYYDIPALLEIFFGETAFEEIETGEDGWYIFESEAGARLEISNGFVFFENNPEADGVGSTEAGVASSGEFIKANFPDFVQDAVFDEYDGIRIIYRQEFDGQLIYTNDIEFFITEHGIAWIEMQFGQVIGYSTESRMIFAPDEILLTFMQRVQHMAAENPIFIDRVDIVYYQEYASDQEGSAYLAVPFYRITISDNDSPFLINAYTNRSIF